MNKVSSENDGHHNNIPSPAEGRKEYTSCLSDEHFLFEFIPLEATGPKRPNKLPKETKLKLWGLDLNINSIALPPKQILF
jgi:hypothetical protein